MCAAVFIFSFANAASAQVIDAKSARVELTEDGWAIDADFDIKLSPVLREAVERGVALYFVVEADLRRKRWYWLDEKVDVAPLAMRVTYNALLRRYRVQVGADGLAQRFDDFDELLRSLGGVRRWRLGDREVMQRSDRYHLSVRMRLDGTQLPKPFQLSAITNRDWSLESEWLRVDLTP